MSGEPTVSDVALASVVAGQAWLAEVLATAALLRGTARAFDLLDRTAGGLVVDHHGGVHTSPGFTRFTGGLAPATRLAAA